MTKVPPADSSFPQIEELYRQYGGPLLLFAVSVCGDPNRAQDAVHHVFLRMMETGSLRGVEDAKAYLFASVRNALANERKFQSRNVAIEPERIWFEPADHDYAAELNLRRALKTLPDDQRQVVVLHIWGEFTFSQIAEVLVISPNTAASRYRYAIGKLREAMMVKENTNG